jgi:putative salt-induced outer membrane protein YdiY
MRKLLPTDFLATLALCGALLLAPAAAADPVVLHLKNGDRLSGELVSESATEIILNSATLGKLTIPRSQVDKRESPPAPPQLVPSAPSQMPANPPAPVKKAEATAVLPPKPKPWAAEFQVGVNMRYSTKDQRDFYSTAKVTYNLEHLHNVADYAFAYGKTEGVLSANKMIGALKSDYDITKRFYVYNLMGAGYDEIRKIDAQYEIGPGLGFRTLTRTNLVLTSELGFTYQEQFRSDATDQKTYSARLAEMATWKISDKLVADAKLEYFANLQRFEQYRLRMETVVRYSLFKNLSLNLNVIDLYDTLPAVGVEKNDLQIRSALGLKF